MNILYILDNSYYAKMPDRVPTEEAWSNWLNRVVRKGAIKVDKEHLKKSFGFFCIDIAHYGALG